MKMYLVFWRSEFSNASEDICICTTEEIAERKVAELGGWGMGYVYKELDVISENNS